MSSSENFLTHLLLSSTVLSHSSIVRAFLIEEQKIVKGVLRARKNTKSA